MIDLAQTVRGVVDALSPMAEELGGEIRFSATEPVQVKGDRDELLRVAENLIENAIKYGVRPDADGGLVEVTVATTEREALLTVRDYGPRDRARAPAAPHRALLSGRRNAKPGAQRHRTGPRHRQAHPDPPSR